VRVLESAVLLLSIITAARLDRYAFRWGPRQKQTRRKAGTQSHEAEHAPACNASRAAV